MSLLQNSIVTITLPALNGIQSTTGNSLSADYTSYFTTHMTPLLATANDVRRKIGGYLTTISDDVINQLNYHHSIAVQTLPQCNTRLPMWQYFAKQWVVLQTCLTMFDNLPAFSGAHLPGVTKTLGDFSITKTPPLTRTSIFGDTVEKIECELYKLEPAVRDCMKPLMDCLGLKDVNARYWIPVGSDNIIKGLRDPNYPAIGRRWADSPLPIATDSLFVWSRWFKTRYTINGFLR